MAKIIFKESGEEKEVEDGTPIKKACEEAGVMFGCEEGYCASCRIQIGEGSENLMPKNNNEQDLTGNDPYRRLACQCRIDSDIVEITNY